MVVPAIAPLKEDLIILERHKTLIADGDSVRIAAQIGDDLPGSSKRRLGIDDPVVRTQLVKPRRKGPCLCERGGRPPELEAVLRKGLVEAGEVLGPEDFGEGPDGKQEVAAFRGDPLLLVSVERPARHNTMDMEVLLQGLAPGVQHHGEADLTTEPRGITPERLQGGRSGPE